MKKYKFKGKLIQHEGMDAAYVLIPFDVKKEFGSALVKVKASFDGVEYRGSVMPMGIKEGYPLLVRKDIRVAIGKTFGDTVNVVLEKDVEERIVEVPADFAKALKKSGLKEAFDSMSFTHRKEYVNSIVEARKPETRISRIEKSLAMIKDYIEKKEKKNTK